MSLVAQSAICLLAEADIDTSLSKKTLMNKLNKNPDWNYPKDEQLVSDAWVAKCNRSIEKQKYPSEMCPFLKSQRDIHAKNE